MICYIKRDQCAIAPGTYFCRYLLSTLEVRAHRGRRAIAADLFSQKLTPTPTPLTGHQVSPGCQTARSDGCHMAHSDGAIWHTPLVPYGAHDRCKSIEKLTMFNNFQTLRWCHMAHSIGAIWHTRSVPYGHRDPRRLPLWWHLVPFGGWGWG